MAGFMADLKAADAQLAAVREQTRETEWSVTDLSAALDAVRANRASLAQIMAGFDAVANSAKDTRDAALEAGSAVRNVKADPGVTAANLAQFNADSAALKKVAVDAIAAKRAMGDLGTPAVVAPAAGGAAGGGGRGPGFGTGLLAGMGFGGGHGIWLPPPFGWGFRGMRIGGGMARLGSLGGLLGFGAERMLASTLGIAGSIGGGLLGGGLLAAGALGTTAVGMGTDAAGIGQAAGDIRIVATNLGALQTAIQEYGRNSSQAADAQLALNQSLRGFSPVARNAVLAAAQTSQAFKAMFDKATGGAEKTGAEIINQAMKTGESFLPTIGKFAGQNMSIIQHAIQPFFSWLKNPTFSGPGRGGGLGIFTNLEQLFQARLPTSIGAITQGLELFVKVIDVAAQQTGGFTQRLDAFVTKWNSPQNFGAVAGEVDKLIGLFRTWMGLLGSVTHLIFDLFKPAVGLGAQFAQSLTDIVNKVREWVSAAGTQNVLKSLFTAHMEQVKLLGQLIQALLPLLTNVVSAFLQIEAAFAAAFNNGLKPIIDAVKWLLQNPIADKFLGWAGSMWLVYRASMAVQAAFKLLFSGEMLQGLRSIPLAFLGIQTSATKAAIATQAEAGALAEVDVAGAGAGGAGLLGTAGLLAGGGFLAGGMARQAIPGRGGSIAQGALSGAGVGAGLGLFVGMPEVGAALGAVVGGLIALHRAAPAAIQGVSGMRTELLQGASASRQYALQNTIVVNGVRTSLDPAIVKSFGAFKNLTSSTVLAQVGLANYQQRMQSLASTFQQQGHPALAAVAGDLAAIASLTHKMPSAKVVRILLRAELTGNGAKVLARMYGIGPGGAPLGVMGPTTAGVFRHAYPPPNLTLPAAIALQIAKANAGHGSIVKADAAAYAYYENLLKRHNLTQQQILAIYQAESPYAPYQTPSAYQHATGMTSSAKKAHDAAAAAKINKVLGISSNGVSVSQAESINQTESRMFLHSLEQLLGGSKHSIAVTAQALGVTVARLSREGPAQLLRQMRQHGITLDAKSLAELRKIQEAIRIAHAENVRMTPAETRKITNWLQQIQQELNGTGTLASNYVAPSARRLVAGLGLTAKQRAEEIARLSSYYLHGKRVPTGGAAGGVPLPSGVGGGVELPPHHRRHRHHAHGEVAASMSVGTVVINVDGHGKDGAALAREIRSELLRIQRRNGAQTRGPNAGRGVGLG